MKGKNEVAVQETFDLLRSHWNTRAGPAERAGMLKAAGEFDEDLRHAHDAKLADLAAGIFGDLEPRHHLALALAHLNEMRDADHEAEVAERSGRVVHDAVGRKTMNDYDRFLKSARDEAADIGRIAAKLLSERKIGQGTHDALVCAAGHVLEHAFHEKARFVKVDLATVRVRNGPTAPPCFHAHSEWAIVRPVHLGVRPVGRCHLHEGLASPRAKA